MKNFRKTVSVVICTFGQHTYLGQVISSLKKQTIKIFQLIIVDNNHDESDFSELIHGLDDVKIVHLSEPNLSAARNIAVQKFDGELLFFLDDDAVPDMDWVEKTLEGFERYNSDMIGGRVNLSFQSKEPRWFTKECRLFLSELTYYDEDIEVIVPPRYLVGTNMAFHRRTFSRFGLFLEDSGRVGSKLISLEDVEMVRRIYNHGGKVTYLNSARVEHIIPHSRTRMSYLFKRAFWQGISDSMLEDTQPIDKKRKKRTPLNVTFFLETVRSFGRLCYKSGFVQWSR